MAKFFSEYQKNVSRGPSFVGEEALPDAPPASYPVKPIAFYLPQFHAIAENDEWWGKGFTEWTNVTKALPRYVGHLQPRLPADLGFYDLGDVETLRRQAELMARGGVYGICIHDYWFSGRKVLEKPLEILLRHRDIDLRFCLNWANENWSRRWDGSEDDILLEQRHEPGDAEGYARSILPALRDARYIRVDSKPLLMVYRTGIIPDAAKVFETWRDVFRREDIGEVYLVMAQTRGDADPRPLGLDAAVSYPPHNIDIYTRNDRNRLTLLDKAYGGHARSYRWMRESTARNRSTDYRWFPGVCPGWDNEARKPRKGVSFYNADPEAFHEWLLDAATVALEAPPAERLVFINAWNEWAESAVLEPDRHHGFANLTAVRAVVDRLNGGSAPPPRAAAAPRSTASIGNLIVNAPFRAVRKLKQKLGG